MLPTISNYKMTQETRYKMKYKTLYIRYEAHSYYVIYRNLQISKTILTSQN